MPRLEVRKIENKEEYIDLLLESGQPKEVITNYLKKADMYGLKLGNELISLAVIYVIDKKTIELKNLVTKKIYRNKGYATKLLKALCGNYKQKYNKMLVGTTENNIPFFVKQGFDKYEKTIKNFFVNNYDEGTLNEDVYFRDMYYYSKNLK